MKAMILAAGRGERMRPLTDLVPKPLLVVGGHSLIVWQIERLVEAGFTEIIINISWLGDQIQESLGDGGKWGANLTYSREQQALETAGGIRYALHLLDDGPFLVVNADVYTDYPYINLRQVVQRLVVGSDRAHLVLVENPPHHLEGDFGLENGRITDVSPYFTFSGISVCHPDMFVGLMPGAKMPFAPLIFDAMRQKQVSGEFYSGLWVDVGTMNRLAELDEILKLD